MNKRMKSIGSLLLILMLSVSLSAGCGGGPGDSQAQGDLIDQVSMGRIEIEDEAVALSDSPAAVAGKKAGSAEGADQGLVCEPSGVLVKKTADVIVDHSNVNDGYVMVKYLTKTSSKLKAQVKGPTTTYTYNLKAGEWVSLPLSDGNGKYQVIVCLNSSGNKYAVKATASFTMELEDEFAPFLRANQYVAYDAAPKTVAKAKELCKKSKTELKKVEKVYNYVVKNFTYDKKKAQTVQSGYLPDLDAVLKAKKGICFDYASVMAGMLRSQGVPCKLVVGYAGEAYHAWISVYVAGEGWIEGVVFFDGKSWQRMDPTFASSSKQSKSIMKYIGDGSNYTAKYFY